jgi:hypothetical protein
MSSEEEINLQRKYYADNAAKYDAMQISEQDERQFALATLSAMIWLGGKISRFIKYASNAFGHWLTGNFQKL